MRDPAVRNTPWLRRAAAVAGAAGLILGPSLLPAAAQSVRVAPAGPAAATPAAVKSSAMTVTGPHMYNPKTAHSTFPYPSTVTVSQTSNLVNQMVNVSWTGFTPSNNLGGSGYNPSITMYPVVIAECHGTVPADLSGCYGAGTGNGAFGPDGPYTAAFQSTAAAGTGSAVIQIETGAQNQALGCDQSHPCSLLIMPSQGGNSLSASKPACNDHSADPPGFAGGTSTGNYTFVNIPQQYACSWPERIVVPMNFAPTPQACGFRSSDFTVAGSPMLVRAMNSWESGLCGGRGPLSMQYNSEVSEPSARGLFLGGATDVGLTTEPATGPGVHPYTYAPVAVTASAVAYWVDDTTTGLPYTNLKMNPRVLAKLMTLSYNFLNSGCKAGVPPPPKIGCDGAVDGNPINLWADPEFQQLNPGLNPPNPFGGFQVPTVVSGPNDMTWEVTRWIGANKDATGFMNGQFDQWGMHVNTNYLGQKYPTQAFIGLDPYPVVAHRFTPVYPELRVAMYQADNWDPGTDWQQDATGNYPADPVQAPGSRSLFAIVDEADAAAFELPSMALLNRAGKYVTPTQASMAAAVRDMTVNPDGITRSYNENSTDPAGYPLTMVVYAMVPTGGIPQAKAAKIAQFLDFVAGAGQAQGTSPGQLPAGYLPLPASLRAQTLKAAYEVLHQTGARPTGHSHGGGGGGGSPQNPGSTPTGSTSPAGGAGNGSGKGSGSASPSTTGASPHSKAPAAFSSPDTAGFARLMLPILLIIGALLALAGPSAVVLGRPGGRAAIAAGWRRVKSLSYLPGPLRGRKK